MAKLTQKMLGELGSIKAAANEGLPATLRDYVNIAVPAFVSYAHTYRLCLTRKDLQAHIDTLSDLITTKVHSRC